MKTKKPEIYDPIKTRIIVLSSAIDDKIADRVIKELLILNQHNSKPIKMIINSPGGQVSSGLAIYDTMQIIKSEVHTIVAGLAASMASILLIGGTSNNCMITTNSKIMIHQPLIQSVVGKASDLAITAEEIDKTKQLIAELYQKKTGKSTKSIMADIDKDNWFSAKEAVKYGLADKIITKLDI